VLFFYSPRRMDACALGGLCLTFPTVRKQGPALLQQFFPKEMHE